jgi:hypothetical protein
MTQHQKKPEANQAAFASAAQVYQLKLPADDKPIQPSDDLLRRGAAAFRQGVSLKVTFRFETAGR